MKIEFRKEATKAVLVCTRNDGSTSWMQSDPFFIMHDLAHFVVESTLKFKKGFYGLVDAGMDISDFNNKSKFNPANIEPESIYSEHLVNLFLSEVNDQKIYDDFNYEFEKICKQSNLPLLKIEQPLINGIREKIRSVSAQWKALAISNRLEFQFNKDKT